jgi:hypothetical protein
MKSFGKRLEEMKRILALGAQSIARALGLLSVVPYLGVGCRIVHDLRDPTQ